MPLLRESEYVVDIEQIKAEDAEMFDISISELIEAGVMGNVLPSASDLDSVVSEREIADKTKAPA